MYTKLAPVYTFKWRWTLPPPKSIVILQFLWIHIMHLVIAHVEPPLRFYCISGSVQKAEEPNYQQHRQCNSNKSFKYKAYKNKWKEHQCKHNFDDAPACSECKANHFSKNPKEKYNKKQRQHDSSPSFQKLKPSSSVACWWIHYISVRTKITWLYQQKDVCYFAICENT